MLEELLKKLGASDDDIAAAQKENANAADIASGIIDRTEAAVRARIEERVVEDKKGEIFAGAYKKIEATVAKIAGGVIDPKNYADLKKDKVKIMLGDLKKHYDAELAKAQNEAAAGDASALDDYRERLQIAHKQLEEKETTFAAALAEKDNIFAGYKKGKIIDARKSGLFSGLQNARFDAATMADLFDAEVRRRGISFDTIDEAVVAVDSEGKPLRNKNKPSQNLTLSDIFDDVADARGFARESNGGEGGRRVVISGGGGGEVGGAKPRRVHPNFSAKYGEK